MSNKTVIDLNGQGEHIEVAVLVTIAPWWGFMVPEIGLISQSLSAVILIAASFFCGYHFFYLTHNRFVFEENGIRLPGRFRLIPYASIKRLYLAEPNLLATEYIQPCSTKRKDPPQPRVMGRVIEYLTSSKAHLFDAMLTSKLGSCDISADVHDKLANWPPKADTLGHKQSVLLQQIEKYLKVCFRALAYLWLIAWAPGAVVMYAVTITYLINHTAGTSLINELAAHSPPAIRGFLIDWVLYYMQHPDAGPKPAN
jgi:hypothetical protein